MEEGPVVREEAQRVRVRGRGSEGRVGAKGQTVVLNYD